MLNKKKRWHAISGQPLTELDEKSHVLGKQGKTCSHTRYGKNA